MKTEKILTKNKLINIKINWTYKESNKLVNGIN
jgi:hypothetical protein